MSALATQPYLEQVARWPRSGRHILAHFDAASIVVYQAYRPSIARYAIEHGVFGGPEFSFSRMSWIKPNFLWMMFRSGWATKEGQEVVLGVRIARDFFDRVLEQGVASTHVPAIHDTPAVWQTALAASSVRLQWDPDHDPSGEPVERRAIQLGLRGDVLRAFATREVLEVIDMSALVGAQRRHANRDGWQHLQTPVEQVYRPASAATATNVGLDLVHEDGRV